MFEFSILGTVKLLFSYVGLLITFISTNLEAKHIILHLSLWDPTLVVVDAFRFVPLNEAQTAMRIGFHRGDISGDSDSSSLLIVLHYSIGNFELGNLFIEGSTRALSFQLICCLGIFYCTCEKFSSKMNNALWQPRKREKVFTFIFISSPMFSTDLINQ